MTISERLSQIKQLLFAAEPAPAPAPAPAPVAPTALQATDYTLQDGTIVSITDLVAGGVATIDGNPAPAGEHMLQDGTKIVVGDMGVITEVEAPEMEPAPAAAPAAPAPDFSQQFSSIEQRFADMSATIGKQAEMIAAFDKALKQSGETMRQMIDLIEELSKAPTGTPAAAPQQQFSKKTEVSKVDKYGNMIAGFRNAIKN